MFFLSLSWHNTIDAYVKMGCVAKIAKTKLEIIGQRNIWDNISGHVMIKLPKTTNRKTSRHAN